MHSSVVGALLANSVEAQKKQLVIKSAKGAWRTVNRNRRRSRVSRHSGERPINRAARLGLRVGPTSLRSLPKRERIPLAARYRHRTGDPVVT
jgi:hypothetical protein